MTMSKDEVIDLLESMDERLQYQGIVFDNVKQAKQAIEQAFDKAAAYDAMMAQEVVAYQYVHSRETQGDAASFETRELIVRPK